MYLRRRFVLGAAGWMAGGNGSLQNDKILFDYTDEEWEFIWMTMLEDGAWAVPGIKDTEGNVIKENNAPEILIKFIAHELKSNIIVFDLQLNIVQFISGNLLKSDNVVFDSPLMLYATGSHFQSVVQEDHEFFISYVQSLEADNHAATSQLAANVHSNSQGHHGEIPKENVNEINISANPATFPKKQGSATTGQQINCLEKEIKDKVVKPTEKVEEMFLKNPPKETKIKVIFSCDKDIKDWIKVARKNKRKTQQKPEVIVNNDRKELIENESEPREKRKKISEMNIEEKREYKKLQQRKRRNNLSEADKEDYNEKNRINTQNQRRKQSEMNKESHLLKMAEEKRNQQIKEKEMNEEIHLKKMADKQRNQRKKERENNEEMLKDKMKVQKSKARQNHQNTAEKRRNNFLDSVKHGRKFECVCCHRVCFQNGVQSISSASDFEKKMEDKFKGLFETAIGKFETNKVDNEYFICLTCNNYLKKGKSPPLSNKNNLQLFDLSEHPELKLTELENCMIALNIIFQKVFQLPKSRWPAMKDRTVNIPIFESDVIDTIESLPRTPNEAGIIPVNLKRKAQYKNTHITQYVSVPKLIKALETLKSLGNKYYQFVPDLSEFKERCKSKDAEGFNFLFSEEENEDVKIPLLTDTEDSDCEEFDMPKNEKKDSTRENNKEDKNNKNSEESLVDKEEEEYEKKDSIKKWQFKYNHSTCFFHNYPEINYKEDNTSNLSIAPGEGKLPTNLLEEKDWDLKTFPGLHPDGENSLNSNRDKKLSEQDYFIQRILNKDTRFAKNPAYVFAASAYVEKKQIQRNTGVSYIRGKSNVEENGTKTFSLNDPYSVLDNIKNTPKYWQKARYELIARLENLGAFNFFFTLSCADMWWPENFVEVLKDKTVKYSSEPDEITVDGVLFDDYLKANADKHQFIKDNLLNATLTFHQRVKMFVKHIIMSN